MRTGASYCTAQQILLGQWNTGPITVAAQSKAWAVFACSDTGIRGFESHLRHGCLVCVCVYSVIVLSCVYVAALRRPRPRKPTVCEKWLRNWIRGLGPEWAGRAICEKIVKKKTQENEMGRTMLTCTRDKKYLQSISRKAWRENMISKTEKDFLQSRRRTSHFSRDMRWTNVLLTWRVLYYALIYNVCYYELVKLLWFFI
jgi:hypothetical protein